MITQYFVCSDGFSLVPMEDMSRVWTYARRSYAHTLLLLLFDLSLYCSERFAKPKAVPPRTLVLSLSSILSVLIPETSIWNSSVGRESGVNRVE